MVRSLASSTLTLPHLIGVAVADSACLLSGEQLVRVGSLLVQQRSRDPRGVCFLGGALSALAGAGRGAAPNVVALEGDLGDDPFLVIAGAQAAVALLATEGPDGFRARLFVDPELADRAAMVLSQFGDVGYSLDAMCDPETQRGFVAAAAAALAADPGLRGANLAALLGDERRWLDLARAVAAAPDRAELLALAEVRALLQESGVGRAVAGLLDADAGLLSVVAADAPPAPRTLAPLPPFVAGALRAQRTGSCAAADVGAGELGAWAGGRALTAAPLLRDGQAHGLLVAASERPLTVAARATLTGLAALLAGALGGAPRPAAAPAAPPEPEARPARLGGLAARLSAVRAPAPEPAPPVVEAAPPVVEPAPSPDQAAEPAPRGAAPSLAQRTMALGRAERGAPALAGLLEHLSDGVVLVDSQGRLAAFTPTAMQLLGLQPESRGRALVDSGAWGLAALFSEALTGELEGPREVELPTGGRASVEVVGVDADSWAFVLRAETSPPSAGEQERSESFLTNFSNIIRVPLRELRQLITQVPAMGNLNEQQSRMIGQVVRLNSEMTMLVNDLLALGQIRLQTTENRAPLRLDLLVEAAVGTQYAEFGRRGQHVITEIQPGLPRVNGSEEGLGRAVAALIDNAIKYCPAGAQITVAAGREGRSVVVTVQDSGPGLGPDELAQVFDPFFRAPSTEALGVSGRGLGLTIAKAVIEQHGGRIWAASAPGHGCAFSFSLPCD